MVEEVVFFVSIQVSLKLLLLVTIAFVKHFELQVIKVGLQELQNIQAANVLAEPDCLKAVTDIANLQQTHTVEAGIVNDIRCILHDLHNVRIIHVLRTCNRVTHRIATMAYEAS
ncbi:hypothetical protein ACLB2K_011640 [Fragaria x ananassa]